MKRIQILYIFILYNNAPHLCASSIMQAHLKGWYPTESAVLTKTLNEHLQRAAQKYNAAVSPASISIALVPHAGYAYSGDVAASVYRLLKGKKTSRIIVLFPSHTTHFNGIALTDATAYKIPTGTVTLDTKARDALQDKKYFHINNKLLLDEHAFEIQLPFIHMIFPEGIVLPLCVGAINTTNVASIAQALHPFIDEHTLIIVSTDFVHYGPRFNFTPFDNNQVLRTRGINSSALQIIEQKNYAAFDAFLSKTNATICGKEPLKLLLALCDTHMASAIPELSTLEPRLIAYDTSSPTESSFVTYMGIVFTHELLSKKPFEERFTQQELTGLSSQLHDTIQHLFDVEHDVSLYYPLASYGVTQPYGAFVTIEKKDIQTNIYALRGCMGSPLSTIPLFKEVAAVIKKTAFHDPRFTPLKKEELPLLRFYLSILSPLTPISDPQSVRLGIDGVVLESPRGSALFLPEVAMEQQWNVSQLLEQIAQKAGLKKTDWSAPDVHFKIFQTLKVE